VCFGNDPLYNPAERETPKPPVAGVRIMGGFNPAWFFSGAIAVVLVVIATRNLPTNLRITLYALAGLFLLIAVVGIIVDFEIDSTRIEVGYVYSHSNDPDPEHPWEEWDGSVSDRLRFVGVDRKIYFHRSFEHIPEVEVALALIDLVPLESIMRDVGCKAKDEQEGRLLQHLHVDSFVSDVRPDYFVLNVGVGVPEHCGSYLIAYLHKKVPDQHSIDYALTRQQLGPKTMSNGLTLQEKWMIDFWTTVGTVKVTWIAVAGQK
jgi:hypothetical protein